MLTKKAYLVLVSLALLPLAAAAQSAGWLRPANGVVSHPFYGEQYAQDEGVQHVGVDIDAATGEDVIAPVSGTVLVNLTARSDINQAYLILRQDGTQFEHVLAHISSNLREGSRVFQGDVIGRVRAWGGNEHVHWGVFRGDMRATFDGRWGFGRVPLNVSKADATLRGWIDPLASSQVTRPQPRPTGSPPASIPAAPETVGLGSTREPGPQLSEMRVTLEWNAVNGATEYDLGVRDLATNRLVFERRISGTTQRVTLDPGGRYRWNVAACNAAGCSRFTTPLYFTINNGSTGGGSGTGGVTGGNRAVPSAPRNLSPGRSSEPGQRISIDSATLQWADVSGATHYEVEIRDLAAKRNNALGPLKQRFYIFKMKKGASYRWQVRACSSNGCSAWSERLYFTSSS